MSNLARVQINSGVSPILTLYFSVVSFIHCTGSLYNLGAILGVFISTFVELFSSKMGEGEVIYS